MYYFQPSHHSLGNESHQSSYLPVGEYVRRLHFYIHVKLIYVNYIKVIHLLHFHIQVKLIHVNFLNLIHLQHRYKYLNIINLGGYVNIFSKTRPPIFIISRNIEKKFLENFKEFGNIVL
jgi:hypothetical protein